MHISDLSLTGNNSNYNNDRPELELESPQPKLA